ncbi:hypothetical protein PTKIN_Ptkin18bG0094200 [Pterospermum kingtungense]
MGYKQNWGAVAPARLISPTRSSSCPRLETILEEGCEDHHAVFSNKVFFLLPVVLSTVFFFLLYKDVTFCA